MSTSYIFVIVESSPTADCYPKYFKVAKSGPDPRIKLNKLRKGNPRELSILDKSTFQTSDASDVRNKAVDEIPIKVRPTGIQIEYCKRGWFKYEQGDPMPTVIECLRQAVIAYLQDACAVTDPGTTTVEQKKE